jgi:serine/threonine protein phosphatase PrpC
VLALIQDGKLFWRHVGDSRLYLFRHAKLVMRTRDHSVLESMQINVNDPNDLIALRYRNLITHCLGGSKKLVIDNESDNEPIQLRQMDMLLLCTDGLWGQFNDRTLGLRTVNQVPLKQMANELANEAYQASKPRSDNITLVVARWDNKPVEPISLDADTQINSETTTPSSDSGFREAISNLRSALNIFSPRKKS